MADQKIKHFIFVRFFPIQYPGYPNIFDVDFLKGQLALAQNVLRSLENQTNKNFEVVFLPNDKYFSDKKYEFIFSTLRDSTTLPLTFIKIHQDEKKSRPKHSYSETPSTVGQPLYEQSELPELFKKAYNQYDFVIQSRLDFDDFIHKNLVADTQSKVNKCDNILLYGYCSGYEYAYGELFRFYSNFRETGHHSLLQSFIIKSSFAKNLPFIFILGLQHGRVKLWLAEFLKKKGIQFVESMFQQNIYTNFIYFRHEFSHSGVFYSSMEKSRFEALKNRKLTTKNITKKQLEEEFGFFHELKSIE